MTDFLDEMKKQLLNSNVDEDNDSQSSIMEEYLEKYDKRIEKQKANTEKANKTHREEAYELVATMCRRYKYEYNIYPDCVDIKTSIDYWKVIYVGGTSKDEFKYNLKHLNKKGKTRYHKQGKGNYNIYQLMKKIYNHENYCNKLRGW